MTRSGVVSGRFIVIGGVRVFPRQILFVPFILVILFVLGNIFTRLTTTTVAEWNVQISSLHNYGENKQACVQPEIDPTALPPELVPPIPPPLDCSSSSGNDADWLKIFDDGTVGFHQDALEAINQASGQLVDCDIIPVMRDGDDAVKYGSSLGKLVSTTASERVELGDSTYTFLGRCSARLPLELGKSSSSKQERVYMGITPRKEVSKRIEAARAGSPKKDAFNVVVLMVDSLSRAAWQRYLSSTVNYFTNTMGGTVLEGYNIVGDGTPQNMFPILMGLSEFEMPESRRFQPGAKTLDDLPWLFKTYRDHGYVTMATEDMPMFSMYNYRFVGFKDTPCDFYTRPFYLALQNNQPVWKSLGIVRDFCQGSKGKHLLPMDWVMQMFRVYKNEPKFAFLTFAELTHDDNAKAKWADEDIVSLLKSFKSNGYLDNTFFVLLSDHGARYDNLRATLQGKLEERLPFVGVYVPPAFKKAYPTEARYVTEVNRRRLATPYDLHLTLVDLLSMVSGNPNVEQSSVTPVPGRAMSLFKEIPLSRTCEHAKIESHWCACIAWNNVAKDDRTARGAAEHVLSYINSLTVPAEVCAKLTLDSIKSAEMLAPNDDLLRFRQTNDRDGYKADMSDTMVSAQVIYQVTFTAKPSGGTYFATVTYWPRNGMYTFDGSKALSRLDRYGSQPWCVVESHPHLRPFCYCKEQKQADDAKKQNL